MSGGLRPADRPDSYVWLAVGLLWLSVAGVMLVWLVARLAAFLGGGQVARPADMAGYLLRGQTGQAWPGVNPVWLALCALLGLALAGGLVAVGIVLVRRFGHRRRRGDRWRQALPSLGDAADLDALTPAGLARRAGALRPSLADVRPRDLAADEVGWQLGYLLPRGPALAGSWEDVAVAFMAPRSGKTTALAIPMVLAAPGLVVATGNKADLLAATAAGRRAAGSPVWVFDPQQIAYWEQDWWWNPLAAVAGIEEADRLAGHFIQEIRSSEKSGGDFWTSAAGDLLAALFLAAASSDRTLVDVYEWLNDSGSPIPVELLTDAGYPAVAAGLRGRQAGAPETREGVYETARAAAKCLRNDRILTWVTPGTVTQQLHVSQFAAGRGSLYLLSKGEEGAASPLVAALTDQVIRAAVRRAEASAGRLDPPATLVLDEAANICKIGDLPDLYSHLGSRGIVTMTILQSYQQGVRVWGNAGMDALWSAATVKVIGAGIDDPKMAEDLSRLVGEHDVPTDSVSYSRQGSSRSVSYRRQRILDAGEIRALPKGRALLMVTGARVAALALNPWYAGPDREVIAIAVADADAALRARAHAAGLDADQLDDADQPDGHPFGPDPDPEEIDDRPLTHG